MSSLENFDVFLIDVATNMIFDSSEGVSTNEGEKLGYFLRGEMKMGASRFYWFLHKPTRTIKNFGPAIGNNLTVEFLWPFVGTTSKSLLDSSINDAITNRIYFDCILLLDRSSWFGTRIVCRMPIGALRKTLVGVDRCLCIEKCFSGC